MKIDITKNRYEKMLRKLKNVRSVGIGEKETAGKKTGEDAIIIGVVKKLPLKELEQRDIVPETLNGIKTDVVELKDIRFLQDRTQRIRPTKGGYSIGNVGITAGTFGCLVYKEGVPFILSNAHVLTSDPTQSSSKKEIVQPGPIDGGRWPDDAIGWLFSYVPIKTTIDLSECLLSKGIVTVLTGLSKLFMRQSRFVAYAESESYNKIDAALAEPIRIGDVSSVVEGIGSPQGYVNLIPSDPVRKSGRTTGLTEGVVTQRSVTISINYSRDPIPRLAVFTDQLIISSDIAFSQGGDSGSAIFHRDAPHIGGLLFAGNEDGTITIANTIQNVRNALRF